jgi:hypothetical protein
MSKGIQEKISRKDFLHQLGRGFILFILLLIPGYLISKKRVARKAENCDIDIQCKNCSKNINCNLIKEGNG